jgi:hypothetical protein
VTPVRIDAGFREADHDDIHRQVSTRWGDPAGFASTIDALVTAAVRRTAARDGARRRSARLRRRAGLHDLYMAIGRGESGGFTSPAINVRMLAYDTARAIFRAAKKHEVTYLQLADLGVSGVQIGIEGPEDVHNDIRGPGSFAASTAGIEHLVECAVGK